MLSDGVTKSMGSRVITNQFFIPGISYGQTFWIFYSKGTTDERKSNRWGIIYNL
jgi:hypothetical protein